MITMKTLSTLALCGLVAGMIGCQSAESVTGPATRPAQSAPPAAEAVKPLDVGAKAPSAVVRRPDGRAVEMSTLYASKPTVLIFYRGGWCPYCNVHLGEVAKIEADLTKLGYQVLAVSPDKPEALRASLDKGGYTYDLLSDSDASLISAYGLGFRVDDATVEKYRGFGIDLDAASGRNHHILPVPAVYIVDKQGVIRFAHYDPDYKKRLANADLLAAARAAATE
jgi:peroxiredoxin